MGDWKSLPKLLFFLMENSQIDFMIQYSSWIPIQQNHWNSINIILERCIMELSTFTLITFSFRCWRGGVCGVFWGVSIPYLAHRIKLQSSTSSKTLLSQLAPYSHWVRVPCSDIKIIKMKAKDAHEFMNLPLKHLEKKQRFILFSQTAFFLGGGQLFFQNLPPKTSKVPNSWTNRSENLPRFPPHICVCFPLPRW